MRLVFRAAAIAALTVAAAASGSAQTPEESQRLIANEFGNPEVDPMAGYLHTLATLPGRWSYQRWREYLRLAPEQLPEACAKAPTLAIEADGTVSLRYRRRGEDKTVPGRIEPWQGRLFSLQLDEKAYMTEFLGFSDDLLDDPVGLSARMGAHQLMVLTPRGPDLMVGYIVIGNSDALILQRCREP